MQLNNISHIDGSQIFPSPQTDKIVVEHITNSISPNGKVIESEKLASFCHRAYALENHIYELDSTTFGLEAFKKAFLGTNKLNTHPTDNRLPYEPEDIHLLANSIFIFKDTDTAKDVGYFTALCFFKKSGDEIPDLHIRFLAGVDAQYRGTGFQYEPLFQQVFRILKNFNEQYPDKNPTVNITQFAMVNPGTPGAITHFSNMLRDSVPGVSALQYGDKEAIKMATMFGLGKLLDPNTGVANINMKIKAPTLYQNKNNAGASSYDSLHLNEGEGIAARQELGSLKDLLYFQSSIESAVHRFSDKKSANFQRNTAHRLNKELTG